MQMIFFVTSWTNIDQKYDFVNRDCISFAQDIDQVFLESDYPLVAVIGVPHSANPRPLNESLMLRSADIRERIPALACEGRFTSEIASGDVYFDGVQAVSKRVSAEEVACRHTSLIVPERIANVLHSPVISIENEDRWCVAQCRIAIDSCHFHDIAGWLDSWPFELSVESGGDQFEDLLAGVEHDSIAKSRKRLLRESLQKPIGKKSVIACCAFQMNPTSSFRCFVRIEDVIEQNIARVSVYMPEDCRSALCPNLTIFDFAFTAGRSGGRFGHLVSVQ